MRRAHHGDVVTEFGSVFRQLERLDRRLDSRAGDQNFVVGSRFARGLEDLALLIVAEQNGFAGRTLHHDAGNRPARVLFNVLLELAEINFAVLVEGRGDGREDTVEKHRSPQM